MEERTREMTPPALGSTAAAVQSCVSLLATVTGQREEYLAYWLDLYYQVRLMHDGIKRQPDAQGITREELLPLLRELWGEALKEERPSQSPVCALVTAPPEGEPGIGDKVRFVPGANLEKSAGFADELRTAVTGTVIQVNREKRWYRVSYEMPGCIGHECFKF